MRWALLSILFLGTGCDRMIDAAMADRFSVEVGEDRAAGAELHLGGSNGPPTSLRRSGRFLVTSRVIHGDGDGVIRVRLKDGSVVECTVGYVTNGARQEWGYKVVGQECIEAIRQ